MASAGSIFVDLLLRDQNYVAGLNRARQNTRGFSGQVQGDLNKTSQAFSGVISPVNNVGSAIGQLASITASALSVRQIINYSDTWRQLEGRLNIVAGSMGDVGAQQEQLFEVAQRTRQPLEGVLSFYTRLAQFIPEAERAQYDLLGVTESVSTALAITGETGASATAAMIQFTQAIGTNFEAAGQELRSLQEQAPRLTTALMNALGDGTKSLQQLKEEGELTRQSVLNALSGMGEEGQKLREELEQVSLTVGQSFTRLDSAFLKFIGQSDVANAGTSSLAAAINVLAQNLDIAVNGALALSGVFVARLIPSAAGVVAGFLAISRENYALQASLYRLNSAQTQTIALNNATRLSAINAATGVTSLATATAAGTAAMITFRTVLGTTLALVGGPLGAAFLAAGAAIFYFSTQQTEAEKVSRQYEEAGSQLETIYSKLTFASTTRTAELRKEIVALYDLQTAELEANKARLSQIQGDRAGLFGKASGYITDTERRLAERVAAQEKALRDFEDRALYRERNMGGGQAPISIPPIDMKAVKKHQDEMNKLYERNRELILGLDKDTLNYQDTLKELNTLLQAGEITQDQYNDALVRAQEEFDKSAEKAKVWSFNIEDAAEQASKNIQSTFADFLFDPFEDGLSGMLAGFANTLRRMAAEAASAQILASIFGEDGFSFGSAAESAPAKSIFSGLFDGFFANGGTIQPGHFGIAGEAGAELVYGGMSGATVIPQSGGGVSVNIINNNNSSVTQSSQKTANGTDITVMIDAAVAANIGTPGSRTNQALGAFSNRSLVRR